MCCQLSKFQHGEKSTAHKQTQLHGRPTSKSSKALCNLASACLPRKNHPVELWLRVFLACSKKKGVALGVQEKITKLLVEAHLAYFLLKDCSLIYRCNMEGTIKMEDTCEGWWASNHEIYGVHMFATYGRTWRRALCTVNGCIWINLQGDHLYEQ